MLVLLYCSHPMWTELVGGLRALFAHVHANYGSSSRDTMSFSHQRIRRAGKSSIQAGRDLGLLTILT